MSDAQSQYLDQKLAQHDPDFLLTRAFIARDEQLFLSALHTLRAELRAIVSTLRDPGVALNKLQWWQSEWQRLAEQQASHPVTRVLQQLLAEPLPPIGDASLALAQLCTDHNDCQDMAERLEFAQRLAAPFAALEAISAGLAQPSSSLLRSWRDIELLALIAAECHRYRSEQGGVPLDLLARGQSEQRPAGDRSEAQPLSRQELIVQTLKQVNDNYQGGGLGHAHIYREVQLARLNWLLRHPRAAGELSSLRRLWAAWRGARWVRRGSKT